MKKITFAQQAEKFLSDSATRKRSPLRPASLRTYKTQIDTHLLPRIGKIPLQDVGNKVVKQVVEQMAADGLSAGTIKLNVVIIKRIRKSAVNDEGDQLYPMTWNSDMIDAPEQTPKQPTVSAEIIQDAISKADPTQKALYALLAGTGLRIAEALAIRIGPDDGVSTVWIQSENRIIVRQQMTRTGLGPTKTTAGTREIDLDPELNNFLGGIWRAYTYVENGVSGRNKLAFDNPEGHYREKLSKDGISGGFHSFRRFRVTHLRMAGVPQPLVDFWEGHAAATMSERYTKVAGEIKSRKEWAAKAGLGFKLPEII